jgi:hypothetical protein
MMGLLYGVKKTEHLPNNGIKHIADDDDADRHNARE